MADTPKPQDEMKSLRNESRKLIGQSIVAAITKRDDFNIGDFNAFLVGKDYNQDGNGNYTQNGGDYDQDGSGDYNQSGRILDPLTNVRDDELINIRDDIANIKDMIRNIRT
jgi:hypothetical protein